MRSLFSVFLLMLAGVVALAVAACPLTMTVSADPPVLLARPAPNRAPGAEALLDLTPVTLTLTLTNTSNAPVSLDMFDVEYQHLRLEVTGPRENSVNRLALLIKRELRAPVAADYLTLQPGESWSQALRFPGRVGLTSYVLRHIGDYQLRLTYVNLPYHQRNARPDWRGAVSADCPHHTAAPAY